jgi:cytoskeleton protein RodZ
MTETFKILASAYVIIQIDVCVASGMTSIGDRLRRQRLQSRISLETVSLETKIGVRMLEAIEADQFEKLPGGVFRRSFVLQYAKALGVDTDEIAAELKQLNQFDEVPAIPTPEMIRGSERKDAFGFPDILNGLEGSTIGSLLAAVGVMMICALIYSWLQTPRAPRTEMARTPPAAVQPKTPQPKAPEPVREQASREQRPPIEAAPAVETAPVRVGLSAEEKTWISVKSDGKTVFNTLLQPHDTKVVEASETMRILIGNAGGLEISLNGKPIGPIGPRGQIRVVYLTPAGAQIRKSILEPL